jgi:hypothetical protein
MLFAKNGRGELQEAKVIALFIQNIKLKESKHIDL